MRREFLTFSKAPIWMECAAAPVLPHVVTVPGVASEQGSAVHTYLEHANTKPPAEALLLVPEDHRDVCSVVRLDRLPLGLGGVAEPAYALDVHASKARFLGASIGRNYSGAQAHEQAGTLDLAFHDKGVGAVEEYKTGWGMDAHVVAVERNHQVRMQSLALSRAHRLHTVTASIHRISESGYVESESVTWDAMDLAEYEQAARAQLARIKAADELVQIGKTPDAHAGSWCTYCPAMESCPAVVGLLRAAVSAADKVEARFNELLNDPATRSRAYEMWTTVKAISGKMGEAVYALGSREPITLANGNVFGPVQGTKHDIDADKAFALIKERHGVDAAVAAVSMKTSMAGLKRAAKVAGLTQESTAKELLAELSKLGAVQDAPTSITKEHKP